MSQATTLYAITPEHAASVTKPEVAFGTTRFLPALEAIPQDFLRGTGEAMAYLELVNALFYGLQLPGGAIEIRKDLSAEGLRDCIMAQLRSWEPRHEHKMAGVAYMLSLLATLRPHSEAA